MGKVVDITNKLDFESNPKIVIKGKEFEVNSDAETVLKAMGIVSTQDGVTPQAVSEMYELLFSEKDRDKISKLKLKFPDFKTLVETAIGLAIGDDEEQGE